MARDGPFRDPSRRTTDANPHFEVPEIDTFAKVERGRIAEPYQLISFEVSWSGGRDSNSSHADAYSQQPLQVHGVAKEPARRAPGLGEHNHEILRELGFDPAQIEKLHAASTVPRG